LQKETYIWGAGHYGVLTALDLELKGIKIKGFIDVNANKINTRLKLPIFAPNKIPYTRNIEVIIAVANTESMQEIVKTLRSAGLKEYENFRISSLVKPSIILNIDKLTSYDVDAKKEVKSPLVRVFVVTYNNAKFARYNLNGILMQKTNFPFEIYIYDDCSTDGTSDIIREYAKKYPNIIADIQSKNYWSKNVDLHKKKLYLGMKNHNCKYVAFADGDDYWTDPYKLQIQVNFLENNADFAMCSGGFLINDNFTGRQSTDLGNVDFGYDFSEIINCRHNCHGMKMFTSVCRTTAISEYKVAKKYKYWRDVHIQYYILKQGKGYYFSRIFGVYNIHRGGIFQGLSVKEQIEINFKVFMELYGETKDEVIKKFLT